MNHLINSLKVEMQCPNEGMAFDVRYHFVQNMQAEMIGIMEEIFSKYSTENEWLRLDKLEINIGNLNSSQLNKNFKTLFARQFEKELLDRLHKIPTAEKKETPIKSDAESVSYFLLNGILPWWVNNKEFNINEKVTDFISNQNPAATFFFMEQKNNKLLWQRVAMQLNGKVKETLVSMFPQLFAAKELVQQQLNAIIDKIAGSIFDNKQEEINIDMEGINNMVLHNAPFYFSTPFNSSEINKKIWTDLHKLLNGTTIQFNKIKAEFNKIIHYSNDETISAGITDASSRFAEPVNNDTALPEEKYLLQQAGIVLLSPFFKPFFTNLQLLDEGNWVSAEAQLKAIQLLYYISTGKTETPEFDVTLEKVLCGLPVAFPVPLQTDFTSAEMEECDSLIVSVIGNWDALKATSIQGFRQTFLQRNAVLKPRENSWLLQVERKTVDVLLDKIPWGFNTVFLPWQPKIIHVEW